MKVPGVGSTVCCYTCFGYEPNPNKGNDTNNYSNLSVHYVHVHESGGEDRGCDHVRGCDKRNWLGRVRIPSRHLLRHVPRLILLAH